MKDKFLKHKKGLIVLAVIGVIVLAFIALAKKTEKNLSEMQAAMNKQEIAQIEKRTLVNSISATGKVTSVESTTIVANVAGVDILAVNVEVGDMVEAGDILCILDSSDLEVDLKNTKTSLNSISTKTKIDLEAAERNLQEAQTNRDVQIARAEQDVKDSWNEYKNACDELKEAENILQDAKDATQKVYTEFVACQQTLKATEEQLKSLQPGTAEYEQTKAKYDTLLADLAVLEQKYYEEKAKESVPQASYDRAVTNVNNKYDVYTQRAEYRDDTVRNNNSTVKTRENGLQTTQLSASTAGLSDKKLIDKYEDQIDECTVVAPISGVITQVNVSEGNTYAGSPIVTIEDISAFEITSEIDEYDIGKIKEGQSVVIKTNGTGDAELKGTVKDIAPRATVGVSGVTYKVTISIDTPNEYLKMDMTAKLSIILDIKEDALTVPYDAVQTDAEGKFYIEVVDTLLDSTKNPSAAHKKIYVTKGIESDYYVEVFGDAIVEGMEAIVPVDGSNSLLELMGTMGPMGGF